jgi:D-glycero-alpha-D-manno-heptose-7-phosphate kinase
MVAAFSEFLRLPLGEYDIARIAYEIERCEVGLVGGKQDQYAAAFGGFNFMEFGSKASVLVNPLRVKDAIVAELESSLVLFYTGRSRESAAIIEEQIRNVVEGESGAVQAMHRVKEEAAHMKECLLRGDIRGFGAVMERAWSAKKQMARSISNDRIEQLYYVARNAGAYAGKVSGAGGGGFMIFLADPKHRLNVVRALTGEPDSVIFSCHFTTKGVEAWRVG